MSNSLEKRLSLLEASICPSYERIAEALPSIDQAIAEVCGGEKPPAINPKGPRFVSLAMLRLSECMKALSGYQWENYLQFKNSSVSKPITEGAGNV